MDPVRFDNLVKSLSTSGTRRGLVRRLAAMPLGMSLATLLGAAPGAAKKKNTQHDDHGSSHRRQRRKAKHRHQTGNNKENRKGERKGRHQKKGKRKKPCTPESVAQTCAGKCATVTNTCGTPVDCGPCVCGPCDECQSCDARTGACVPAFAGETCGAAATCQGGVATPAGTCDSAGSCQPGTPQSCDPYECDGDICATTCNDDDDCAGTAPDNAVCCNGVCWDGCCGDGGAPGACLVFVTSSTHTGNLGGLGGADDICQDLAENRPDPLLPLPGTYKAWLSTETGEGPSTRFRRSRQPYVLVDAAGTQVADDWTDLTSCNAGVCLDHEINVDQTGTAVVGQNFVWTNTDPFGGDPNTCPENCADCNGWMRGDGGLGAEGDTSSKGFNWSGVGAGGCQFGDRRLYCFQQR